jgi:AcrR family transcriptional regulator
MASPPATPTRRPRSAKRARPEAGRRAQNKEATRDRIVAVALQLFQSKGFDATTTREIARRAGIAEGTVFNYFPTKDDIALHFFEREVDHAIATVRGQDRLRRAPLEEQLFALVQAQLEYLAPYEQFIGTAFVHALRPSSRLGPFSHRAQALRHRYMAFVQELFEQSLPKKTVAPVSWWAPGAFWIYYLGALLYWLHDTSPKKQHTLAFLDRSLEIGVAVIKRARL